MKVKSFRIEEEMKSVMKQYPGVGAATEQTLMKIWADVLKLDRVGLNDNFFDLGGDSILGTLILARAAQAGVMISPRQLFEHQTIAELSNAIR